MDLNHNQLKFQAYGFTFYLLGMYEFCDIYYGGRVSNLSDDYLIECFTAEMNEFDPETVIWTVANDNV